MDLPQKYGYRFLLFTSFYLHIIHILSPIVIINDITEQK